MSEVVSLDQVGRRRSATLLRAHYVRVLIANNPGCTTETVLKELGITKSQLTLVKRFLDDPVENPGGQTIRYDTTGSYTGKRGWYATCKEYASLFEAHQEHVEDVILGLTESIERNLSKANEHEWSALQVVALKERLGKLTRTDQGLELKLLGFTKSQRKEMLAQIPAGTEVLPKKRRQAVNLAGTRSKAQDDMRRGAAQVKGAVKQLRRTS